MSNVLPIPRRSQQVRRFRLRLLAVAAAAAAGVGVVASLLLLPTLLSVRIAAGSVERAAASASMSIQEDQVEAQRAQTLIDALMPIAAATTSPTDVLFFALERKPSSIHITGITVTKGVITLTGSSESRSALNAYSDSLRASGRFASVVVPVAALVGAQEGRFSITLSGIQ